MRTITWAPGTDPEHDALFEQLRQVQYNDHTHRLWKNYGLDSFKDVSALTIYFDDNGVPEVCASILARECWPNTAYRILNRAWKPNNKKQFLRRISDSMGQAVRSQIAWLHDNTDSKLYFISRQTTGWEEWMITHFKKDFDVEFKTDNYLYLTCPNECDDTCWQKIIYSGDEQLLTNWKRK